METREIFNRVEQIDTQERRARLLAAMANHIGQHSAVGMAELYEIVFERPWGNRINDTRALRTLITILRGEGVPINSVSTRAGGGYYYPAAGSELSDYIRRNETRALKILGRNAKIKRMSLPNYLGQMRLNMEAGNG